MNEYDKRQYRLMGDRLREFEKGQLDLRRLIDDLYALLEYLRDPDPSWKDAFLEEWWTLEEVYAVELDRGETELQAEGRALVKQAIENLKRLLADVEGIMG